MGTFRLLESPEGASLSWAHAFWGLLFFPRYLLLASDSQESQRQKWSVRFGETEGAAQGDRGAVSEASLYIQL